MFNTLNRQTILSAASAVIIFTAPVASSDRDTVIENTAAVMAAQPLCGLKVDLEMLQMVFNATGISATQFEAGGIHYSDMERHKQRIQKLTSTDEGRSSFCRNVKIDLSSMFK